MDIKPLCHSFNPLVKQWATELGVSHWFNDQCREDGNWNQWDLYSAGWNYVGFDTQFIMCMTQSVLDCPLHTCLHYCIAIIMFLFHRMKHMNLLRMICKRVMFWLNCYQFEVLIALLVSPSKITYLGFVKSFLSFNIQRYYKKLGTLLKINLHYNLNNTLPQKLDHDGLQHQNLLWPKLVMAESSS